MGCMSLHACSFSINRRTLSIKWPLQLWQERALQELSRRTTTCCMHHLHVSVPSRQALQPCPWALPPSKRLAGCIPRQHMKRVQSAPDKSAFYVCQGVLAHWQVHMLRDRGHSTCHTGGRRGG